MTDSPRFSDAPQRLEELTAVLAQMGAVVLSAETIDSTIELVATLAAETIPATTGAEGDPGRRTRQTKHGGLGPTFCPAGGDPAEQYRGLGRRPTA